MTFSHKSFEKTQETSMADARADDQLPKAETTGNSSIRIQDIRYWSNIGTPLLLFALSTYFGMTYVATYGQNGVYFQQYYGPAVMVAAGRGFVNPDASASPMLNAFLEQQTRSLDVRELPELLPTKQVTQLQARWLYMLYTVGTIWRFLGVSWDSLLPLFGIFCGSVTVTTYYIFRLVTNRFLAAIVAIFLTLSPFNLLFLPDLRDYSKAPFILGSVACLGALIKLDLSTRRQNLLVTSLGIMLGIGLGFRKDVIICIPPAIIVFLLLLPGNPLKQWRKRTSVAILFLCSFLLTAWPLLSAMREKGGTTAHVLILGLMEPFDKSLGIGGAPYSFGQEYLDAYVYSQVNGYWLRQGDGTDIPYATPSYDNACSVVHRHLLLNFPADMVVRWIAATERILDYGPFLTETWIETSRNPLIERLFLWRWHWFKWMSGAGLLLAFCTSVILAAVRLRFALGYMLMVAYFTGYSSLQFQHRHYFHLEFICWWPIILGISLLFHPTARNLFRSLLVQRSAVVKNLMRSPWPIPLVNAVAASVLVVTFSYVPLEIARLVQKPRVERMYEQYRQLSLEAIQVDKVESGSITKLKPRNFSMAAADNQSLSNAFREDYLVLEFDASEPIVFWTQYDESMNDYSSRVDIAASPGPNSTVKYFLPVFQAASSEWYMSSFDGISVPSRYIAKYRGMYRVANLENLAVLMPYKMYPQEVASSTGYDFLHRMKPLFPRAMDAMRNNLLENGSFEEWIGESNPKGFDAPHNPPSVERETQYVSTGSSSAKLTWTSDPGPTSILARFRTKPIKLKPNSTFEVFLDCYNPSKLSILVGVWELSRARDGSIQTYRITPAVVEYTHNMSFARASGVFTTSNNDLAEVVFTVSPSGAGYPSVIYLDNLALMLVE